MMNVRDALLFAGVLSIDSLDAEVLLAHCLQCTRTNLFAWPEKQLTETQQNDYEVLLQKRCVGMPVAYLIGEKEFWSNLFFVTPATLIPRPETELLVEKSLAIGNVFNRPLRVLDLGSGSGCIAISIAKARPGWQVIAVEQSPQALVVIEQNCDRHNVKNVLAVQSDWFDALEEQCFDMIVSNPPYIAKDDPYLQSEVMQYEPTSALLSGATGLDDLRLIIENAKNFLSDEGVLLLEHGFDQRQAVVELMKVQGYTSITHFNDLAGIARVVVGYYQ